MSLPLFFFSSTLAVLPPYVTSPLTRGWVCFLWIGLASVKCTYRTYSLFMNILPLSAQVYCTCLVLKRRLQSYVTDCQWASLYLLSSTHLRPKTRFFLLLDSCGFIYVKCHNDERTGLSFRAAACSFQRSRIYLFIAYEV